MKNLHAWQSKILFVPLAINKTTKDNSKIAMEDSDNEDFDESSEDDNEQDGSDVEEESELGEDEAVEAEDDELDGEDEDLDDEDMDGEDEEAEEAEEEEDEDDGQGLISDMIGDDDHSAENDEEDAENLKNENRKRIDSDVKKGNSIKNQLSLWDLLLECRIKYHKTISLCNQLPQGASGFKSFTQIPGENHFVTAVQSAQNTIKTFLDSCLELQV